MAEFRELGIEHFYGMGEPQYGDYERMFDKAFGYGYPEHMKDYDRLKE